MATDQILQVDLFNAVGRSPHINGEEVAIGRLLEVAIELLRRVGGTHENNFGQLSFVAQDLFALQLPKHSKNQVGIHAALVYLDTHTPSRNQQTITRPFFLNN